MTATSRPNLGGLFSGRTPPERSSSIADALRPRGTDADRAESRPESTESTRKSSAGTSPPLPKATPTPPATPMPTTAPVPGSRPGGRTTAPPASHETGDQWAALQWLDPVRALGYYFDFLQGVFDAQRRLTMGVAAAVTAPIRRAGVWR